MNTISDWIARPWMEGIGWVLLHSLWQGALIAGLFEAARFLLRRSSAQARYVAGCIALALMFAAPLVTLVRVVPDAPASSNPSGAVQRILPVADATHVSGFVAPTSSSFVGTPRVLDVVAPWFAMLWIVGVAIFAARLTRSWWWVGTLRTREVESVPETLLQILSALRQRIGVSRPVRLLRSALVEVPTVVGWLKPVILLPAATLAGLTPRQLEAILAHELAHVKRFDYLVNTFQCVVETLLFYHPATWWISRCIREEREHCCDDMVVRVFGDRLGYARALAAVEEARAGVPRVAFAATGGSLFTRIRRLVGFSPDGGPATAAQVSGLVLLAMGIALIAWGVFIFSSPKVYAASVQMRIPDDTSAATGASRSVARLEDGFESLRADSVLERVVNEVGLAAEWKIEPREAIDRLRSRIRLEPHPDSSLVTAHVTAPTPEQATRIANAFPQACREHQIERDKMLALSGIEVLEKERAAHEELVRTAQEKVDRLRIEVGITDMDPQSTGPTPSLSAESLRTLITQLLDLRGLAVKQKTRLEQLLKLDRSERRYAIQTALDQPDPALTLLLNDLSRAEQEALKFRRDLSEEHAMVVSSRESVAALNAKIDQMIDGILNGLQTQLFALQAQVKEIQTSLDEAKARDRLLAENTRPYYVAKQRLEELQHYNTALHLKILAMRTELNLPRRVIEVMRGAVPPSTPIAPNRSLAGALVGTGALCGISGLVLVRRRRS